MGNPTGDFYLQPVQLYRSWRCIKFPPRLGNSGAKLSKKLRGTEFKTIKLFIFPFTNSNFVARVPCALTQKSKNLVLIRSNAEHLLIIGTFSVARSFLDRGESRKKFCFAPKLPSIFIN